MMMVMMVMDAHEDEESDAVSWLDWGPHPLKDAVCGRLCGVLREHWGERRPLYLAGALLIKTTASHTPSPAHVDKANIGYGEERREETRRLGESLLSYSVRACVCYTWQSGSFRM